MTTQNEFFEEAKKVYDHWVAYRETLTSLCKYLEVDQSLFSMWLASDLAPDDEKDIEELMKKFEDAHAYLRRTWPAGKPSK